MAKTAVFMGDKGAGKSALQQVFLNQSGHRDPSSPLEYSFGRKTSMVDSSKELAHLYEVGGGKPFSELIKIPIGSEQHANTLAVIVLDLTRPEGILQSLAFWNAAVRRLLVPPAKAAVFENSLVQKHEEIWAAHEDKKHLSPMPVPVLVVANKYDAFIKEDP